MTQDYLAFYWTLPVPWAGFISLPVDIEAAAKASRTIAYQRARAQAHVRSVGGRMIVGGEVARLELYPDRGSPEIAAEFAALLDRAGTIGARVIIVDFSTMQRMRWHAALRRHYRHPLCDVVEVDLCDVHPLGIDPYLHFTEWRARTQERIRGKGEHRSQILVALDGLDCSLPAKAAALNALGLATHGGKPWTGDNLRKFLRSSDETALAGASRQPATGIGDGSQSSGN